jgi:hypothetical protein
MMEIQDYPNYLIYEDGRVFSKKKGKFINSSPNSRGYVQVKLIKDGKQKTFKIHRLIAIHYIPNPDNKPEVDHINRITTDNRLENLRWVNRSENMNNTGMFKNNTSGHKNITYHKRTDRWVYQKRTNGERVYKYFKTLDEAISFKENQK